MKIFILMLIMALSVLLQMPVNAADGRRELRLTDFLATQPAGTVSDSSEPGKWELRSAPFGRILYADSSYELPELTYPLDLKGVYDIYVGLVEAPYSLDTSEWQGIHLKLTSDTWYTQVCGGRTGLGRDWKNAQLDDIYWKRADMTGQNIIINQPFGRFFRPAGGIAYLRLVPVSDNKIKSDQALREKKLSTGKKSVAGMADFWSLVFVTGETDQKVTKRLVDNYKTAGLDTLYFQINADAVVHYPSKVAQMFGFKSSGEPREQASAFEKLLDDHDPLKVASEYARVKGITFMPWFRVTNEQHLDNESLEYVKNFKAEQIRGADGQLERWPSLAYPQIREYKLAIIREILTNYKVDGILLDFQRTMPVIGYEEPIVKTYLEKYKVDVMAVPSERSSMRWKRFRAAYVTEFVKGVRSLLDEAGKKQGVRLKLAVRVTPRDNLWKGLDVEYWVRKGMVDILIPSNYTWFDPAMPLTPFIKMVKGTKCKVCPAINPFFAGGDDDAEHHPNKAAKEVAEIIIKRCSQGASNEEYMKAALDDYAQGADGVVFYEAETMTHIPPLFPGRDGLLPMFQSLANPYKAALYYKTLTGREL